MDCESCGMPMQKPEDHGAGDIHNKYCKHCAPDGRLMSREEVRQGWIRYSMRTENISREKAGKKVDEEMSKMPAWRE